MTSSILSRTNALRRAMPLALAFGSLALASLQVHAADVESLEPVQLDEITVSAPSVKVVGQDVARISTEDSTVTAHIQVDPQALRTEYGALMLKYSVRDAARQACYAASPMPDDGSCYRDAVKGGEAQADAAIARARSTLGN